MEIVTKRFLLREFTEEDEPGFLAYHSDPRYAEFYAPAEAGADHAHERLRRFSQWATENPRLNYQLAVSAIRNPRELFGCCGLRRTKFGSHQAEMGIELAPQHWGRYAYAIEIASAMLEFGFVNLELAEVRGVSVSANARVSKLAHRYGFVEIGQRPTPDWMRARGWNQTEWQLTREGWDATKTYKLRMNAAVKVANSA